MRAKIAILKARYWDVLSASEQRTVLWGVWVLSPVLAYALLWLPAHESVRKLQPALAHLRAQYMQMKTESAEAQSLQHRAQPAVLDGAKIKGIVEAAARKEGWGAPAFSVETVEEHTVHIAAERIAFAQWLRWLNELEQIHHIRATAASVTALPEAGMVKIGATLSNGIDQ